MLLFIAQSPFPPSRVASRTTSDRFVVASKGSTPCRRIIETLSPSRGNESDHSPGRDGGKISVWPVSEWPGGAAWLAALLAVEGNGGGWKRVPTVPWQSWV